jgi:hypothetical protein
MFDNKYYLVYNKNIKRKECNLLLTKKGLKMSISKCFTNGQIEKSQSVVTQVWGKHRLTNGYKFIDDLANNRIVLTWQSEERIISTKKNNKIYRIVFKLNHSQKLKKAKNLYSILDRHGFSDYMKFNEQKAEIYLINFI